MQRGYEIVPTSRSPSSVAWQITSCRTHGWILDLAATPRQICPTLSCLPLCSASTQGAKKLVSGSAPPSDRLPISIRQSPPLAILAEAPTNDNQLGFRFRHREHAASSASQEPNK